MSIAIILGACRFSSLGSSQRRRRTSIHTYFSISFFFVGWLVLGVAWGGSYQPCKASMPPSVLRSSDSYSSSASTLPSNSNSSTRPFRVFDATTFKNKPDLSVFGIEPVKIIYENAVFEPYPPSDALPSEKAIRHVAAFAETNQGITILDVEKWIHLPNATQLYVELTQHLKEANPALKIGYYSVVPKRDYWRAKEDPSSEKYQAWQKENDQLQDVADCLDYLLPSLYTFYDYQPGWVDYAEANIAEARRVAKGKPVYVFLWFQYHESNAKMKLQPIPADFWKLQLETAKRLADGIVLWGGVTWDPNAPWWIETEKFLSSLREDSQ